MGAHFLFHELPGTKTVADVRAWFTEECRINDIQDGQSYSGQWNMCAGIEILSHRFKTIDDAEMYLTEHAKKWEAALAVKATKLVCTATKSPTYGGKVGADQDRLWTVRYGGGGLPTIIPADELPPTVQAEVVDLVISLRWADQQEAVAVRRFTALLDDLGHGADLDVKTFRSLQRARFDLKRTARKIKIEDRLKALRTEWEPTIRPVTETTEEVWAIGCWAAS